MLTGSAENNPLSRRATLFILAIALVLVYILWNTAGLRFITYPLNLFVTYIHEAGHSLAAILTGGEVLQFVVSPDGSGLATTRGGAAWLVIPAGYLGAAAFGAALFYAINRFPQIVRSVAVCLGVFLVIFTLLYARPDEGGAPTALIVGIVFGFALIGLGLRLPRWINLLVLNILAVMTSLNAVLDVWYLVGSSDSGRGGVVNDAAAFSQRVAPLLPAAVWAFLWVLIAALLLGAAVYFGIIRPMRRGAAN
jgi:hypothetical protein